jgi:hypothetical protein
LDIFNCVANDNFQFQRNTFIGPVLFSNNQFNGFFEFFGATIKSKLTFISCQFGNIVEIENTRINQPIAFYDVSLPDTLILTGLMLDSLSSNLDFTGCRLNDSMRRQERKCLVRIFDTDISKIVLPSHLFTINDETDSSSTTPERIDQVSQIYERLIRTSREAGLMSSAEGWDIEYQSKLNNQKKFLKFRLGPFLNSFHSLWWNFGYSKWKILWIWLPFFYILFTILNFLFIDRLMSNTYKEDSVGENFKLLYSRQITTREKFLYSIFYTAKIYFGFKLDFGAINYKNAAGFTYIFLIYIVGLIHVTFAVAGYLLKV